MLHLLWEPQENTCRFGDRRDAKAQGGKAESYWWICINFPFWLRVEEDPGGPCLGNFSCWEHWDFACKTGFELQLEMPLPSAKSKGTSVFQTKRPSCTQGDRFKAQTRVVLILWLQGCQYSPSLSRSTNGSGPMYLCDFDWCDWYGYRNYIMRWSVSCFIPLCCCRARCICPASKGHDCFPSSLSFFFLAAYTNSEMPLMFYPCYIPSAVQCKGGSPGFIYRHKTILFPSLLKVVHLLISMVHFKVAINFFFFFTLLIRVGELFNIFLILVETGAV